MVLVGLVIEIAILRARCFCILEKVEKSRFEGGDIGTTRVS